MFSKLNKHKDGSMIEGLSGDRMLLGLLIGIVVLIFLVLNATWGDGF